LIQYFAYADVRKAVDAGGFDLLISDTESRIQSRFIIASCVKEENTLSEESREN